jgi:hypothetical protein
MIQLLALLTILAHFGAPVALAATPVTAPSPKPALKPMPVATASPRPPREKGVKSVPRSTQPIVLHPKVPPKKAVPAAPTSFVLSKTGPGKLLLRFVSTQPNLTFDTRAPLVVQLNAAAPLALNPSVITRKNWPKGATQMEISYTGAKPGQDNAVMGGAAYTVCDSKTKKCIKAKSNIDFKLGT